MKKTMEFFNQTVFRVRFLIHEWIYFVRSVFVAKKICPDLTVGKGPFTGLKYPSYPFPFEASSTVLPKLVGSYEEELHGIVSKIQGSKYKTIINIGCEEGYYAVGLARNNPKTNVIGYDLNKAALRFCEKMSHLNGVGNMTTISHMSAAQFNRKITGKTFILCDCEGCEFGVLNPLITPRLKKADILVEIHDSMFLPVSKVIAKRFSKTHTLKIINFDSSTRKKAAYKNKSKLSKKEQIIATDERRFEHMQWYYLHSKTG